MTLLEQIATKLTNVKWDGNRKSFQCGCPVCLAEGHDSEKAYLKVWENGAFNCIVHSDDPTHNRAIRAFIHDGIAIQDVEYQDTSIQDKTKIDKVYPEDTLTKLVSDYSYWMARGIKEEVLREVGGGLSPSGKSKLSDRYVFPCRDEHDQIIGWAARLVKDNNYLPKWKILGTKKSFFFMPLSISQRAIKAKSEVIIVESIGCALSLASAGIKNVWCIFGTSMSSKLVGRLIGLNPDRIIIATNNETSKIGNDAAEKIRAKLCNFFLDDRVIIKLPTHGKDFNEMTEEQIGEWYGDR